MFDIVCHEGNANQHHRHHHTTTEMLTLKTVTTPQASENVEKRDSGENGTATLANMLAVSMETKDP